MHLFIYKLYYIYIYVSFTVFQSMTLHFQKTLQGKKCLAFLADYNLTWHNDAGCYTLHCNNNGFILVYYRTNNSSSHLPAGYFGPVHVLFLNYLWSGYKRISEIYFVVCWMLILTWLHDISFRFGRLVIIFLFTILTTEKTDFWETGGISLKSLIQPSLFHVTKVVTVQAEE